MLIQVRNRLCIAHTVNQGEAYALINILTITEARPDFVTGEKRQTFHYQHAPVGALREGYHSTVMFRAGLMNLVHTSLAEVGVSVSYEDNREFNYGPAQYPDAVKQFTPHPDQLDIANKMALATRGVLNLCTGYGKALSEDMPVLTPSGWVAIKDLNVGDYVIGADGHPTKVLGVYPQGARVLVEVKFSDGASVTCDWEHLWYTQSFKESRTRSGLGSVKTSREIADTLVRSSNDACRSHRIPLVGPVLFDPQDVDLPIHPYLLGLLLGDGHLGLKSLLFSNSEDDVLDTVRRLLPGSDTLVHRNRVNYGVNGGETKKLLAGMGLLGKHSHGKFIPPMYLRASVDSRVLLLRGLCDTDGCIPANSHRVEYGTVSGRLSEDVTDLVRGLGGFTTTKLKMPSYSYKGEKKQGRLFYRMSLYSPNYVPVSSTKHLSLWLDSEHKSYRSIVGVYPVGEGEACCIKVEADDGLFVTKDFVVTHNTYLIGEFWNLVYRPQMLVLVPSIALLNQTSEDLEEMHGLPKGVVGRVGDGKFDWQPVTVAITNSAARYVEHHKKFPLNFNIIIADEGHSQVGKFAQLSADACNAFYRFWISGTAAKTDTTNPREYEYTLKGLAGELVADMRTSELIDAGRLKRPLVRFIQNRLNYDTSDSPEEPDQYRLLKKDEERNDMVVSVVRDALARDLSVVVFVEHVKHGELLQDLIGRNIARFVRGGRGKENDHIRGLLKDGVVKCVVCTSAWRMGVSIPAIDVIVNAAGKKSMYLLMQLFGRLLRQSTLGYGFFIDFVDEGMKYPQRQAGRRMDAFTTEGINVSVVKDVAKALDPAESCYDMFGKVC